MNVMRSLDIFSGLDDKPEDSRLELMENTKYVAEAFLQPGLFYLGEG